MNIKDNNIVEQDYYHIIANTDNIVIAMTVTFTDAIFFWGAINVFNTILINVIMHELATG